MSIRVKRTVSSFVLSGNSLHLLVGRDSSVSSFCLFSSVSMSLGKTVIYSGHGGLHPHVACECLRVLVQELFLVRYLLHFPSVYAGCFPFDRGYDWCGDYSLLWISREASSLLCDFHSPSRGRFHSPVVGVQDCRFPSELYSEVGGTGALLPGEEPLSIPLQAFHWEVCALVLPATCCMD